MKGILLASLLCLPAVSYAQAGVGGAAARDSFYSAREYTALYGAKIFSYSMMSAHFQLYQGYVKNLNLLIQRMKEMEASGSAGTSEYAGLKRRFGWEFNGMRLHELYFGELGAAPLPEGSALRAALAAQYGSFDAWSGSFLALAGMRGSGWAALVRDRQTGRLFNVWLEDHDSGLPAGCDVLLVMDLFEHAYTTDFQLDKARYAQAFMAAVNWLEVDKRYSAK